MRSLGTINSIFLLLVAGVSIVGQKDQCKSSSVEKAVRCANVHVEYKDVTSSKLIGKVQSPLDTPTIVEVFKIEKSERKEDSRALASSREPFYVFETDAEGEFCHPALADGYYVIRFGTAESGFNCSWVKVKIFKGATERKIKVELILGT